MKAIIFGVILFILGLITLTSLCFSEPCQDCQEPFDVARMSIGVIGGGVAAGSGPCDGITGSVTYLYNGDYTSDTDAACSSAKAKLDGTVSGTATVSGNYVLVEAVNSYLKHSITSSELSTLAGTICFSIYVVDDGDGNVETTQILEIGRSVWDSNNYIYIEVDGDGAGAGRAIGYYKGNGTVNSLYSAANGIAPSAWHRMCYSWSPGKAGNDHAIGAVACGGTTEADCVGANGWSNLVEADEIAAEMTAQPEYIAYGEDKNGNTLIDDMRIADVYILSGYKTADPF